MTSGLRFLIAARRCEIDELQQLASTCELAHVLGQLIHELQRERGVSNLFLTTGGRRYGAQRHQQLGVSDQAMAQALAAFEQIDPQGVYPGSRARLFNRIAYALHGLDAVAGLRQRVEALALPTDAVIAAYVKVIASLLAVVFEAADSATDPEISRHLVAYFHFIQGKETAGQERALGVAICATATQPGQAQRQPSQQTQQQQLLNLIDAQERCLQIFSNLADPATVARWGRLQAELDLAELERLRRVVCTASTHQRPLEEGQGLAWFDACTRRIDAMRQLEDVLAQDIQHRCRERIAQAQQDLLAHERLLEAFPSATPLAADGSPTLALDAFFETTPHTPEPAAPALLGPQLERAVLDMMQEQSLRLQSMSDELSTVRAALHERKVTERAKGLLMTHRQLSEEAAYRLLRQTAMEQNRRLIDVAESVLALEGYLARSQTAG